MVYPPAPPPPSPYGAGSPPPSHLPWAILTTILCCPPLGIVSIVFAAQVNSKWRSGDHAGALKSSNNAKTWAIVTAVVGIVLSIISFFVQMSMAS